MKIHSNLLGELEFDDNMSIHFSQGIPGFENDKQFILIPMEVNSPFFYLQSINNEDLCLLLADPFVFFPDYEIDIDDLEMQKLDFDNEKAQLAIYLVLSVPADFKQTTANLRAPIVINPDKRKGMQYISSKTVYTTRHNIFRSAQPKSTAAASQEGR